MARLAIALAGIVLFLSMVPSSVADGEASYDVKVVAEVEWHSQLRYWDVGVPAVTQERASALVNVWAWLDNALFFGKGDAKDVVFTLSGPGFEQSVKQSTGEGSRLGSQEEMSVVFQKVPAGTYTLTASIPGEDSKLSKPKTTTVTIGGG